MKNKLVRGAVLVQAAFGSMFIAAAAWSQTQELQRVEITGSSIKRIDTETALPVQVITREEIARSGVISTEQLLNSISAISSMGATTNAMGAGSSTFGLSSISLRGLQSARTLVLVNGRRVAPFASGGGAAVDVNTIPLAAIERVEVLKDGASGVYGSDAIAGVVNFILTKSFRGVEIGASVGTPTRKGGGKTEKLSLVAGIGDPDQDRFTATVALAFENERTIFASDRDFARNGNVAPFFESGATGQGNIEGAWIPGLSLAEVEASGGPPFFRSPNSGYGSPGDCAAMLMFLRASPGYQGAPVCAFDSAPWVGLIPDRKLASLSANLNFKLSNNLQLFGDVLLAQSTVRQSFQANPLRASFLETDALFEQQGVDPALLIYPNNPNYPTAYLTQHGFTDLIGKPLAITSRDFILGNRVNTDDSTQMRVTAGLRGLIGAATDYEIAYSFNQSKVKGKTTSGYFSQLEYVKVINDPANNLLWNPWAANGAQPQELVDKLKATQYIGPTLEAKSTSSVLDGKLSGSAFKMSAGEAQYATGFQVRDEKYQTSPSPALFSGDIAGLGGSIPPVDRARKVDAAFAELNLPLLRRLEGNVAVRHDRYDDVGSTSNYNLSLRWKALDSLLLRGSTGTGFRAPTLTDLWTPQTLGTSAQFNDPATGQTGLQVNSLVGGNPNLKPETSKQASIGVVFAPVRSVTLSVDLFQVRIKDIINNPSVQEIVSGFRRGDPAYAGLVKLSPTNQIQQVDVLLANAGDATVSGADIELVYRDSFGFGRLDLSLAGTYMDRFDETSPGGTVSHKVGRMVDDNGDPVLGADVGGVVLRWKHTLAATLTRGPWAATLVQNFYKGYRDGNDLNGNAHFVPSQALYDLQLAYTGIPNLRLAVGAKNVFDKDPPLYIPASNQFQVGYDSNLYDPRARFVYVNAAYKF
jgi:iron complex outermembrane recepter protein